MFFYASKFFALLFLPSSFVLLLLVAGLVLLRWETRRRLGQRLIGAGAVLFFALGFLPMGNFFLLPLEQRFASVAPPSPGDPIAGIIMLGGFEDGWVSSGRGGLGLNEAAERLTEGVRLAIKHPEAKLVFTGGVAGLLADGANAVGPVGSWLRDMGIAQDRIVLEGKSRNTEENARFTRDLVGAKPGDRWVLVTSAYHMPRSVGVFRRAGFDVIPYPVDYRLNGDRDLTRLFEKASDGLKRSDLVFKEWVGLVAYWLSGRTSELFPAP